jgi:hypothetical protein
MSALILGQTAAPFAAPNASRSAPFDTGAGDQTTETGDDVDAAASHRQTGLPDFDARRDPDTHEIDLGAPRAAAPGAVAKLLAKTPGVPSGIRIDRNSAGFAREIFHASTMLTNPATGTPDQIARQFLADNAPLFGLTARDVRRLKITMNHLDEQSGVTFLKYEQRVGGVPVFDSEISLSITPKGEVVIATAGNLVTTSIPQQGEALDETSAIARAFELCDAPISREQLRPLQSAAAGGETVYANPLGEDLDEVVAERQVVNVRGEARSAYHVFVEKGSSEWYDTLVEATTGDLILRRNLYADAHGMVFTQNPTRGPRTDEAFNPRPFNGPPDGDPWTNNDISKGNNVDAYLDTDGNNKPDAANTRDLKNGRAFAPTGDFTYPFQTGGDPRFQQPAGVANLFYFNNYMHDWMYSLGFTESARNFQLDNYARGGKGRDFVKAESQDGSGTNNANFATPPDGKAPRMQMFLWTSGASNPTLNRDSSVDGDVVFHEYGHGVSNRLIGNGSGLGGTQSDAMGEGWSDYWAVTAFNDPVMGEYSSGSLLGIRRAPYDGRTGAPNGDYAMLGAGGFEVHRDGEIWCQTLVDLRNTLGVEVTDRLVLTGMAHTATHPSFLSARDGILAADRALFGGENACLIWTVFARHGMGFSAEGNDGTTHVAAYDRPQECAQATTDNAQFYTTDGRGRIAPLSGYGDFRPSWSTIVAGNFGGDSSPDLLFYDPAANVGEFYTTDGEGHISLLRTHFDWDGTWDMIIPGDFGGDEHTDLLFYDRPTGVGAFYTTDGQGGIAFLKSYDNWRHSWDLIIPGEFGGDGHTDLLFYDRAAGTGEFYTTDGAGNISLLRTHDYFRPSWDLIVPGYFGGDGHTDLLFYDRSAGVGEFYTTDGAGGISILNGYDNWRSSWYQIVVADFGDDSHTDLLFYQR